MKQLPTTNSWICSTCGSLLAGNWVPRPPGQPQPLPKFHCLNQHCSQFNVEKEAPRP